MRTMADAWTQYRESATPKASEAEMVLLEAAFYSGAIALANIIVSHMSNGPEVSPEDDAFIFTVMEELSSWGMTSR